jgi:hypothetical protein
MTTQNVSTPTTRPTAAKTAAAAAAAESMFHHCPLPPPPNWPKRKWAALTKTEPYVCYFFSFILFQLLTYVLFVLGFTYRISMENGQR